MIIKKYWKCIATILILLITLVSLTGCGSKDKKENSSNNSKSTQKNEKVEKQDQLEVMSSEEYQNLNKFFDAFAFFNPLQGIKTEEDVLSFGIWRYQDGMGEFSIPKEKVEKELSRYFGVVEINHDAVGENDMAIPSYKEGFYNSGGGVGWITENWCNVSELTNNGDGTYTAIVSLYEYEGFVSGMELNFNRYDKVENWTLLEGQEIVDDGNSWDDGNIHRIATDTVILKPYKYNGEDTWQIININGWDIPKSLYTNE